MSEPIPEAIPTSSTRDSRPTKRRNLGPRASHASSISALFANPDRNLAIPSSSSSTSTTTSPSQPRVSAPPEIVANVQGSSAGAGSGEFHVYKASRRREYERLRAMDDELATEQGDRAFRERRDEVERRDRVKTERNRLKRAKAAARKQRGKGEGKGEGKEKEVSGEKKRKLVPSVHPVGDADVDADADADADTGAEPTVARNEEEIGLVIEDDD